jgi:hypothetical protein
MEEERGSFRDRRSQQSRIGLSFLQCQVRAKYADCFEERKLAARLLAILNVPALQFYRRRK